MRDEKIELPVHPKDSLAAARSRVEVPVEAQRCVAREGQTGELAEAPRVEHGDVGRGASDEAEHDALVLSSRSNPSLARVAAACCRGRLRGGRHKDGLTTHLPDARLPRRDEGARLHVGLLSCAGDWGEPGGGGYAQHPSPRTLTTRPRTLPPASGAASQLIA